MATLRRPPSKDKDIIGRFLPDAPCKNHPKHRQSPGVCSLCLKHKLSQLPSASSSSSFSSSRSCHSSSASSSLSSYYSSSASSCASPTLPFPFSKDSKTPSSSVSIFLLSAKHTGVLKTRSMSVLATRTRTRTRTREAQADDYNNKTGKKTGFWSKLLHPKSKRIEEIKGTKLVHASSLIETVT